MGRRRRRGRDRRDPRSRGAAARGDSGRHAGRRKKKERDTDGYIAYWLDWCASEYGWDWETTMFRVPVSAIALYWRARRRALGKDDVMPLETIEKIDMGEI